MTFLIRGVHVNHPLFLYLNDNEGNHRLSLETYLGETFGDVLLELCDVFNAFAILTLSNYLSYYR